jgi:hypothetical protein
MKYILITGKQAGGKSTTIKEVCRRLNPTRIWQLDSGIFVEVEFDIKLGLDIVNGTYIIEVQGKLILVVAGSPTEQKLSITIIVNLALKFKPGIKLIIVAKRVIEYNGYNTVSDLDALATKLYSKRIHRIEGDLEGNPEWEKRVTEIVAVVESAL